MFTGLVSEKGEIVRTIGSGEGARMEIGAPDSAAALRPGDSVSVSGVCLTAREIDGGTFATDVMAQTLRMTTLGNLGPGDLVNLELPLAADGRFGGHFVQGHVDGVATVKDVETEGFSRRVRLSIPPELEEYVVDQGSIALDGVSLTVAGVAGPDVTVSLIPETLERTTLGGVKPGDSVNVEVDVLAKQVANSVSRILAGRAAGRAGGEAG